MSEKRLNAILGRLAADRAEIDMTRFQANVWAGLEGHAVRPLHRAGLAGALAVRAVPAVLALVVGGIVGTGLAPSDDADLLAVFASRAEWSLASVLGGETGL